MASVSVRPSVVAAAGLVGGFAAARYTKRRDVGGLVFAAAGAWCGREWSRSSGTATAAGLGALYTAAMGGAHSLARAIGPWPSVLVVAGATAAAAEVLTRRRPAPRSPLG